LGNRSDRNFALTRDIVDHTGFTRMVAIETALTRLLGIAHPILLAPMGSAAGGKLAAAVTSVGGLGLIGSGYAR
jgi:Nitronate monooxygenase